MSHGLSHDQNFYIPYNQANFSLDSFFDTACCNRRSANAISWKSPSKVARTYGTKIPEAVAPASLIASATFAKTGRPRCVCPAFFGFVPPTTCVPKYSIRTDTTEFILSLTRTVLNCLCSMESADFISFKLPTFTKPSTEITHVPCFPVKP